MKKVILVDAWHTFVTEDGMHEGMYKMLETFKQKKIILTNANDEQLVKLGIVDMPYDVFTMKHNPDKVDPTFYKAMLNKYDLKAEDVVYFEHSKEAVESASSLGIKTYWYDKDVKDVDAIKAFLLENIS